MVRRTSAVELLPLGGRRPRRGFLPAPPGGARRASRLLHLAQHLAGGREQRRRPAVAAFEAQVIFRHGPSAEEERSRWGREGVSVSIIITAAVRPSGVPLSLMVVLLLLLTEALRRPRLASPTWVVPEVKKILYYCPIVQIEEYGYFSLKSIKESNPYVNANPNFIRTEFFLGCTLWW